MVDLCSPDRGFLFGSASRGEAVVAEWQGQSWNLAFDVTSVMPNGQVANTIAALGINEQGDVLFQFADGDSPIRINAMDFRDDGSVYFLAVTALGEVVLYKARPLL